MFCVTRVAMNASSLILLTIHALKKPVATPASKTTAIVRINGTFFESNNAASVPQKAAREPGDRSFCPAMIRYVCPTATRPTSEAATSRFTIFAHVRKFLFKNVNNANTIMIAAIKISLSPPILFKMLFFSFLVSILLICFLPHHSQA